MRSFHFRTGRRHPKYKGLLPVADAISYVRKPSRKTFDILYRSQIGQRLIEPLLQGGQLLMNIWQTHTYRLGLGGFLLYIQSVFLQYLNGHTLFVHFIGSVPNAGPSFVLVEIGQHGIIGKPHRSVYLNGAI